MHSAQQARPGQPVGPYITLFWLHGSGLRRSRTLAGLPELAR
jgi:predicted esterase